ncbi:MAG TPA: sugar kinase [Terriglobia bacterium]|nr:sugar kinase [Terriglobia bacterium]
MSPRILVLADPLVEVMRKELNQPLSRNADFVGPFPSGAGAIFIDAAARLGGSTGCIGVVGLDAFGECVVTRLREDNVDTAYVRQVPGYTTGIAFVAYNDDGSRNFLFHLPQSAAALLGPEDVRPEYIVTADFLHITGSVLSISESARQACYKAVKLIKKKGGRVSFDPNIRPELLGASCVREIVEPVLEFCDLLLPSSSEAAMLTGDVDETAACHSLLARGISIVALKRGSQGSVVFTPKQRIEVPSLSVTEIDPTGAGDCYGGAFVVGLLEGWDLPRIARFANIAGALSVTRMGPMEGSPRRSEVMARMSS